jgi:hypothetical protein
MATGGLFFAATVMVLAGILQIFQGIAGIAKDNIYVSTPNYTLRFDTTAWGWIHLIIGIVVAVTGFFVFTRAPWARFVGIGLVAVQAFSNFFFVPYYPFWAITLVAIDIFVIWALASAHDRPSSVDAGDMRSDRSYEPAPRSAMRS